MNPVHHFVTAERNRNVTKWNNLNFSITGDNPAVMRHSCAFFALFLLYNFETY